MRKKLLFLLFTFLLIAGFICADWYYNPSTGTIDYYEPAILAGGLTGGTIGDVIFFNGTAWAVLNRGANTEVLTLAAGLPSWAAAGAGVDVLVGIDVVAVPGYLGAAFNDGVLRVDQNELTYTDGGNFVTLGLANHATARSALGLGTTDDPTFDDLTSDKMEANESFTFDAVQTATGDGTTTIDWGLGNNMYFTFGAQNDTFTFTAPPGVAKLVLVIKQDGVGSRTITWPGTVLWPGNVAPTLSTGVADVDIVTLFWDGTNYFGLFNGDFS